MERTAHMTHKPFAVVTTKVKAIKTTSLAFALSVLQHSVDYGLLTGNMFNLFILISFIGLFCDMFAIILWIFEKPKSATIQTESFPSGAT